MAITSNQKKLIHFAARKLGLSDETYRLALVKIGGVTSSNDLTPEGFEALLGYFEYCGFRPLVAEGASYGKRKAFASPTQVELIRTLWMELHGAAELDEAALHGWLNKWFKVSSLRFLTDKTAPKVITALKEMKQRRAA